MGDRHLSEQADSLAPMSTTPDPSAPEPTGWEPTLLPHTGLTLDQTRAKLSGLHFAQEVLSDKEREILYLAEGLLRLIDERDPNGYAR